MSSTSCLVSPLFQEKTNPRNVPTCTRGEKMNRSRLKIHFLGPNLAPMNFVPLIWRRNTITPRY